MEGRINVSLFPITTALFTSKQYLESRFDFLHLVTQIVYITHAHVSLSLFRLTSGLITNIQVSRWHDILRKILENRQRHRGVPLGS